jgi:hypothetical protein
MAPNKTPVAALHQGGSPPGSSGISPRTKMAGKAEKTASPRKRGTTQAETQSPRSAHVAPGAVVKIHSLMQHAAYNHGHKVGRTAAACVASRDCNSQVICWWLVQDFTILMQKLDTDHKGFITSAELLRAVRCSPVGRTTHIRNCGKQLLFFSGSISGSSQPRFVRRGDATC